MRRLDVVERKGFISLGWMAWPSLPLLCLSSWEIRASRPSTYFRMKGSSALGIVWDISSHSSAVKGMFLGETWYYSLPRTYRDQCEKNWDTLRNAIASYFMNRKWLDQMKGKANKAYYREPGLSRETPSQYFIQKYELSFEES